PEQRAGAGGRLEVEVGVCAGRGDAPPGRALQEAFLDQVRLVDLLDGAGILAYRDGQVRQPGRAAAELLDERQQDAGVHVVEAVFVHVERIEGAVGDLRRDTAVALDLREVARAAEQTVGDARRTPAAARDLEGALRRDLYAHDPCRAKDDLLEQVGRVVVVAEVDAE